MGRSQDAKSLEDSTDASVVIRKAAGKGGHGTKTLLLKKWRQAAFVHAVETSPHPLQEFKISRALLDLLKLPLLQATGINQEACHNGKICLLGASCFMIVSWQIKASKGDIYMVYWCGHCCFTYLLAGRITQISTKFGLRPVLGVVERKHTIAQILLLKRGGNYWSSPKVTRDR